MVSTLHIGWFDDIGLCDRSSVGGKGGSLGELWRSGIAVPPGFVVRTAAFEEAIIALETQRPLRARVESLRSGDLETTRQLAEELQARIMAVPLPAGLRAALRTAHSTLCANDPNTPLAVRSSATTEDGFGASFAGMQDTYLWTIGSDEVEKQVRRCWASLYSVSSLAYRRKRNVPESGVAMAVVVQRMVDARSSGITFTCHPTTGDRSVIVVEGAWGLGTVVVGGQVTPDRFIMRKDTGEILGREINIKHVRHVPTSDGAVVEEDTPEDLRGSPCVRDDEVRQLCETAQRIEKHYGAPQDIEWAIDRVGRVLILQSRPETVWSAQGKRP